MAKTYQAHCARCGIDGEMYYDTSICVDRDGCAKRLLTRTNVSVFVTCETISAIVIHARVIGNRPIHLGGHIDPKPKTLCGTQAYWDCRVPVSDRTISCRDCKKAFQAKTG